MKVLSKYQTEFLLQHFFKDEKFAGWREIANKLLETGECIVAGSACIWYGGIGNFIETKPAEGAINCLLYKFDLDNFLTSALYESIKKERIAEVTQRKAEVIKEYHELLKL